MSASYYTVVSLHKSCPKFQYTYTHHQGSETPQKSPQRNLSLHVSCNLPLYYKHAQNLQAQQQPCIGHPKRTESTVLPQGYPWGWQQGMTRVLRPIPCKSCPDYPSRTCVHWDAMQKQKSNLDDQLEWQQSTKSNKSQIC